MKLKLSAGKIIPLAVTGAILAQSATAFAWGRPVPRHRSFYRAPHSCLAPAIIGLAGIYAHTVFHRKRGPDYVVIQATQPAAVVVRQAAITAATNSAINVNIPNSNGSYTTVTLQKSGNGYLGPQGEYYPGHPTVEQLRTLYGS